jgi:hypothetical protein
MRRRRKGRTKRGKGEREDQVEDVEEMGNGREVKEKVKRGNHGSIKMENTAENEKASS